MTSILPRLDLLVCITLCPVGRSKVDFYLEMLGFMIVGQRVIILCIKGGHMCMLKKIMLVSSRPYKAEDIQCICA